MRRALLIVAAVVALTVLASNVVGAQIFNPNYTARNRT